MSAEVYRAVADPHRRQLLDALRDHGEQSLSTLCDMMPISRQGVTKHLRVLESAGLVRVRRHGRERLHRLDSRPLRELADWTATYSLFWNARLDALESRLEE
ncbi:metalloregulator ArsR/SmtB family transcription factor [Nocardioides rotundus]|uniref:ArsR/SmtB family transcription factor n=1 Tax=Nocardioides rotundus TaxID=1774216 RepID=UPI001CBE6773|nr:metalloregulator ArsR/SmtB family transcription factor [Nocardioides rotundus]UAL28883.1 metalloregulator ArsR/SmtB family transcription factor [Nocardioides rotundus]